MHKIAGVVVLYNPDSKVFANLFNYFNQIEFLWIVDNSNENNEEYLNGVDSSKLCYLPQNKNIGIAAALNLAINKASEAGFDFVLTMDQDSIVPKNYISSILPEIEKDKSIGVISPFIVHPDSSEEPSSQVLESIDVAITSGSVIRISSHNKIGGFEEKLFIDYVDHEYCLKMREYGFNIYKANNVSLFHHLGEIKKKKFFFRFVYPTNHSPIRLYYRTRNRFYVYDKYKKLFPDYIKLDKKALCREISKILLFEDSKIEKIRMIILGYIHYKKNIFGKLKEF